MNLHEAEKLANDLLLAVRPYCLRAEVAGSIRRRKREEVKDVELVVVPKWEPGTVTDLFGDAPLLNRALVWAFDAEARGEVQWIKPGTSEVIPWEPKRDGKYWRGLLPNGAKLDLFLATPENFGLIYLIRTGAASFSQAVVTHAKRIGMPVAEGILHGRDERAIPTPEEADVFRGLGLEWVEPEQRTGPEVVRASRPARQLALPGERA